MILSSSSGSLSFTIRLELTGVVDVDDASPLQRDSLGAVIGVTSGRDVINDVEDDAEPDLIDPSLAATDITADVNFTALEAVAVEAGWEAKIWRQDDYLAQLGVRDRISEMRHRRGRDRS